MIKKIKEIKKKIESNKLIKFVCTFIKAILFIILILLLLVIIVQKLPDNKKMSFGGFKVFNVITGSMKPVYEIGDIIFVKETNPNEINIGDDISYLGSTKDYDNLIITHRVIKKRVDDKGNLLFTTKGVNNDIDDGEINSSQIYGKVVYRSATLSFISRVFVNNLVMYYVVVSLIGISISVQIVSNIFQKDEEDIDEKGEKTKS